MKMKLWVVGKYVLETDKGAVWELQGVFDNEGKALKACKKKDWFVAPVSLNEEFPEGRVDWPGVKYPNN